MPIAEPRDLIDMLGRMEHWRQEPSVERQRAFKRFSIRGEARIEPVDDAHMDQSPRKVMLRDIARGGVGFLCDEFLDVGTVWRMAFCANGMQVGTQVFIVKYCRLVQDGLFLIGGGFTIEPHIMLMVGVDEAALDDDINDRTRPEDTADFVAPDDVDL